VSDIKIKALRRTADGAVVEATRTFDLPSQEPKDGDAKAPPTRK
jgi:hypothetical protein